MTVFKKKSKKKAKINFMTTHCMITNSQNGGNLSNADHW